MILEVERLEFRPQTDSIELQQQLPASSSHNMDEPTRMKKRSEHPRSVSAVQGVGGGGGVSGGKGMFAGRSYYSVESMVLLICLTASLLLLPLILPPLPPPPLMLLMLPIGMLAVLLTLAFMPSSSSVRDVAYAYV